MGDGALVYAIAQADLGAVVDAHEAYGQELFDYCQSQLADVGEADRVVEDTFVVAWARAPELRKPDQLRTWLFAVARRCCHLRLMAGSEPAYFGDMPEDTRDLGGDPDWTADLLWATWTALAGMNPREREVVELSLRHGLDAADLSDVLGVSRFRARALALTTRGRFEAAADLLLATSRGRPWYCEAADVMFASLNGDQSRVSSRWMRIHSLRCKICGERRRNNPGSAVVMRLLPAASLTGRERQRLLRLLSDDAPKAVNYREKTVERIGPYSADGYPERAAPPQVRWRGSYVMAGAAAVVAVGLLGGGAALVDAHLSNQSSPPAASSTQSSTPATTPAAKASAATSTPATSQQLQLVGQQAPSPSSSKKTSPKTSATASASTSSASPASTASPSPTVTPSSPSSPSSPSPPSSPSSTSSPPVAAPTISISVSI